MPTKYLQENETLLGIGAVLLSKLSHSKSLSQLWYESKNISDIGSYERFILALDMLYILGLIKLHNNKIMRIKNDL
jgi:hypothetical protein